MVFLVLRQVIVGRDTRRVEVGMTDLELKACEKDPTENSLELGLLKKPLGKHLGALSDVCWRQCESSNASSS